MKLNEKIRSLRELNNWSQEDMAERMQMSKNGYARIERGESKLNMERLEQIANVFNIDIIDLITQEYEPAIFLINCDSTIKDSPANNINTAIHYNKNESIVAENERLKLTIQHKDELLTQKDILIAQKDSEIATLKTLVAVLQKTPTP